MNNLSTTQICLCILIISGALACLALAILLFSLLKTVKQLNKVISSADTTVQDVNSIVEDVQTKLKKLEEPVEASAGIINDGFLKTGLSSALGLASFALKKHMKKGKN